MSIFDQLEVACPGCGVEQGFKAVRSVNAGRHARLRDEILADTFQTARCASCGASFRPQPAFSYFDEPLGLWINVRPMQDIEDWAAQEQQTRDTHAMTFTITAPATVQEMGERLTPRLVFGWSGLREKILARQHGLDDVTLELAKLALIRAGAVQRFDDDTELRLAFVDGDELGFVLLSGPEEEPVQTLTGPAALLSDIEAHPEAWAALREQLSEGFFVDVDRLFVEG